jgi:hypothetical protein
MSWRATKGRLAIYQKKREAMKLKPALFILFFLLFLSPLSQASQERHLIIGFGAGYSFALDSLMATWELDWAPSLIYFKERTRMKHNLNFNLQYFFNKRLGLQLEFNFQKISYFSHLEWYGKSIKNPDPFDPEKMIIYEINHIEEPYTKSCNLSSLTLSVLIAERRYMNQRMFSYLFAGFGGYLLSTDEDLVLNRWRLGPGKTGLKIKAGGGLKYRITPKVGLNLRLFFDSIWRKYGRNRVTSRSIGTDQFDFDWYMYSGKVGRVQGALVKSFTHFGLDLSLEFWLKRKRN